MGWGAPGGLQEGGVRAKPLKDGLASGAGGELVHAQIAWRSRGSRLRRYFAGSLCNGSGEDRFKKAVFPRKVRRRCDRYGLCLLAGLV